MLGDGLSSSRGSPARDPYPTLECHGPPTSALPAPPPLSRRRRHRLRYAVIALTLAASVDRSLLKANTHVLEDTLHRASGLPLAQIGVCAATLSSALSYLLGASHVLHAVATESSWPSLAAFAPWAAVETATLGTPACATQLGPATEQRPVRALVLAWGLAQLFVLSGDLKALAPLVTGFFLVVACLINLVSIPTPSNFCVRPALIPCSHHTRIQTASEPPYLGTSHPAAARKGPRVLRRKPCL